MEYFMSVRNYKTKINGDCEKQHKIMTLDKVIKSFVPEMRDDGKTDDEIEQMLLNLWSNANLSHCEIISRMDEVSSKTGLWSKSSKGDE